MVDKVYLNNLTEAVKTAMDKDRYNHTVGVAYTAAAMAMRYGEGEAEDFTDKALIAGFLHDCAKCLSAKELMAGCAEYGIPVTVSEENNPFLLHGKLGAYFARSKYGIEDEDIINAVKWHTTGRPGMSKLEKIIFVADYIEPGRYKQKNLKMLRETAFIDLDRCVYLIAGDTVDYLTGHNKSMDEMTVRTRDYYADKCNV